MSKRMRQLLERGGIFFKDDPANPGGGGGGSDTGAADTGAADTGTEGGADTGAADTGTEGGSEEGGDSSDSDDGEGSQTDPELRRLVKESMKRKDQLRVERAAKTDLETKLAALEGQLTELKQATGDASVEELKDIVAQRREAERLQLEAKGEYDRILEQVRTEHSTSLSALTDQLQAAETERTKLMTQMDEMTSGRSFAESPFIREKSVLPPGIARKEFSSHFEMRDGKLVGFDKPSGSESRTPLVDGEGNTLGFEAAIERLYTTHPDSKSLMKSTAKKGAGSKTVDTQSSSRSESESQNVGSGLARISAALASKKKS